jgi:hypothetical protein
VLPQACLGQGAVGSMTPEGWIVLAALAGVAIVAVAWFVVLMRVPAAAEAMAIRDKARLVVIVAVVVGTCCLAVLKHMTGDQVLTIFGTIVGFVLGEAGGKSAAPPPTTPVQKAEH